MIKLVLCDMDGTLVPFGADGVSTRSLRAIHTLMDAGIRFGPSSGRELSDLVRFFRGDLDCLKTGILGGGKLVYLDGKVVSKRPLPREELEGLVSALWGIRGACFNFYLPFEGSGNLDGGFGGIGLTPEEAASMAESLGESFEEGLYQELPEGDITTGAVLVDTKVAEMNDVHERLDSLCPKLDFVQSAPFVFDVVEKGWSKLDALPVLQDCLGVDLDEIAYFGDSHNDLTMLEAMPNSFCPSDGSDDALRIARYVIGSCANDGVARVLESLALNGGALVESEW